MVRRSRLIGAATAPFTALMGWTYRLPSPRALLKAAARPVAVPRAAGDYVWYGILAVLGALALWKTVQFAGPVTLGDLAGVVGLGLITMVRVLLLIALASAIWTPIGVYIGMRPALARVVQPVAQFLAAFPANLLFPVAVWGIVTFQLNPDVWLSPLMVLGTQWYILFNVIAGASLLPRELRDVSANLQVRGWLWWRKVALPGVFPFYVTGAITRLGRLVERRHRRRGRDLGQPHAARPRPGRLYRRCHRGGRFPPHRARHRGDEFSGHGRQPPVLAAALLVRRAQIPARLGSAAMEEETLLDVQAVGRSFQRPGGSELLVLDGVDLTLRYCEIVGLLGRSGSGKSTLLRIISACRRRRAARCAIWAMPSTARRPASPWCSRASRCSPGLPCWRTCSSASKRSACRPRRSRPRALGDRPHRPGRLRIGLSARAVRRHAPARRLRPRAGRASEHSSDGRAVSALDVLTAENLRTDFLDLWNDGHLPIKGVILVTLNIEERC